MMTEHRYGFSLNMAMKAGMGLDDMKAIEDLAFDELPNSYDRIQFMVEQTKLPVNICRCWDDNARMTRILHANL